MNGLGNGLDGFEAGIGRDAVAEVEDKSIAPAHLFEDAGGFGCGGFGAGQQQGGVEVALHGDGGRNLFADIGQTDAPVDTEDAGTGLYHFVPIVVDVSGKYKGWNLAADGLDDPLHPMSGNFPEFIGGECSALAVEKLDGVRPGGNLRFEVDDGGFGDLFEQGVEEFGFGVEQGARPRVFAGASPFDHEGGERPGRSGKADQGAFIAEFLAGKLDGFGGVGDVLVDAGGIESVDVRLGVKREVDLHAALFE